MRLPPTAADGLEPRDWEGFKQDVNDFFADLFSPVCTKYPKTLGCPKPQPEPEPEPQPEPDPPILPNPIPPNPSPPGNPGHTPPGQAPPATTTRASNPAPTTPAANPPPAATTTPAPVVSAPVAPAPQPTAAPGNGNDDGNGNDGDGNGNDDHNGNGNGNGNAGSGSGGSNPSPTRGGEATQPRPTTTKGNIGGNVLIVVSETASGPRPTGAADPALGGVDDPAPGPVFGNKPDGPGPGRLLIDNDSGSQAPPPKEDGGSHDVPDLGDGYGSGSGSTGNNGSEFNGDGIAGGDSGSTSAHPDNNNAKTSPLPGIIGAVVSLLVLLLILLALLYKYRRTRRVQSFLIKFTPLKISPYSKLDRKRSSMGSELMFGCRGEGPYTDEKRPWSMNYGSMNTAPTAVTQPNPVAARRSLRNDGPPTLELDISLANTERAASPTSQFEPSPLSPCFPNMRTPPPARRSPRSSQDSAGGLSIASSGVFNPSIATWPVPSSTANSVPGSPPSTANTYDTGPIIVGRSTPTRYKPVQPAQPSNWQRPQNWE